MPMERMGAMGQMSMAEGGDPLSSQLDAQWRQIQRTMQAMHRKAREDSQATTQAQSQALQVAGVAQQQHQMLLMALAQQQQTFMQSMGRAMDLMEAMLAQQGPSETLSQTLDGMTEALAALPEALGSRLSSTLNRSRAQTTRPTSVRVTMPRSLSQRLDALQEAVQKAGKRPAPATDPKLLEALQRSRSRTFGSNY